MNRGRSHDGEGDVKGGEDGEGVAAVNWHGLALRNVDDHVGGDEEAAGSLPYVRIRELQHPLLLSGGGVGELRSCGVHAAWELIRIGAPYRFR